LTTLLAVDDSNTMRKVMEITFAGEDFKTVVAANSAQALDQLQQTGAMVAVVDAALGAESGYDLCQRIKGASPKTRVLLLSSKQNPFDAHRGAAAGADDHIDKPFDTQTLIDKVRNLARSASLAAPPPQVTVAAQTVARAVVPQPPPAIAVPIPRSVPVASAGFAPPVTAPVVTAPLPGPALTEEMPLPRVAAQRVDDEPRGEMLEPVTLEPQPSPDAPRVVVPQAAPVPAMAATLNGSAGGLEARLAGLGLSAEQVAAVLVLSREVIEQAVWEVVPTLAETLIKEEIARLTK
jgi:CheY-like chemotaxis protein